MISLMVTLMRSCRQNVPMWRGGDPRHTLFIFVSEKPQLPYLTGGLPIDGEPVSGTDLERTTAQWQDYCMQYIDFAPEEGVLKGSRLQVKSIISHISRVQITPDTPIYTVVQYACAVALLLLGGTMCPDSSGNLVSLLYLAKLEDIVEVKNYSWGSVVLAFLYRELCNASTKGKTTIGGALQLIWAWSRIIPLCPELGAPRVHMGQHSIDNNRVLPTTPYGAIWNCEHTFTRTVRTTVRGILTPTMEINMSFDILCHSGDASSRMGPSPIRDDAKYSKSARYSGHEPA
ncbi:UNVERIFIED_CONTAM: protein MAINTENANCE OF MERISTEMS [Sesamum angustifolium]|uniref:Protein MAINTENANCE OF MERISTEMS n=1 Tax=Sesamum angustifolium TaxID=2727405 RepID=A0AAW2JAH5_9LAMI